MQKSAFHNTLISLLLATVAASASASAVSVSVRDRSGAPVRDVVVIARSHAGTSRPAPESTPIVMDQMNRQFAPYVVAVHTGASVLFTNSDSVAHQVYSFSPTRQFELGLYRGRPRSPIVFDKPGVVVLGCNIHDNMIGYVYVTDAPWFGTTGSDGNLQLSGLPAGDYVLEIWSPRQSARESALQRSVAVGEQLLTVDFRFQYGLDAEPGPVHEQRLRDY
ncbi:MAG TPA: methylamine utilization protein [Povalibacter sp.]|nr:methylamine utilization protein [Povalibacter sp.]